MIYTRQARRADGRAAGGGFLPPYAALLCIIALVQVRIVCGIIPGLFLPVHHAASLKWCCNPHNRTLGCTHDVQLSDAMDDLIAINATIL